jgi:hypothetical protein
MKKQTLEVLPKQFFDNGLTQSTFGDILTANGNNQEKALEMVYSMNLEVEKQQERERESKIKELQDQFRILPKNLIIEILETTKWIVDDAIVPLFLKLEEYQSLKPLDQKNEKKPFPVEDISSPIKINESVELKESPFKIVDFDESILSQEKEVSLYTKGENFDCGELITVEWNMIKGKSSPHDWIGLFALEKSNKNYNTYKWRGKEEKKGFVTFQAPSVFGVYEFRYIPYGSYEHIGISNPVKIGPQVDLIASIESKKISVKWDKKSGNHYNRSWVGLFSKSEINNKNYISWQYTTEPFTQASFDAPIKPGEYEFRYFPYSYFDTSRSNILIISGNDFAEAFVGPDNTVSVKISIVTVDPYYDAVWVGLYSKLETNQKNLKRYKYIGERKSDVSFRAPEVGEYEFRLFSKNSSDPFLVSNAITILEEK